MTNLAHPAFTDDSLLAHPAFGGDPVEYRKPENVRARRLETINTEIDYLQDVIAQVQRRFPAMPADQVLSAALAIYHGLMVRPD